MPKERFCYKFHICQNIAETHLNSVKIIGLEHDYKNTICKTLFKCQTNDG